MRKREEPVPEHMRPQNSAKQSKPHMPPPEPLRVRSDANAATGIYVIGGGGPRATTNTTEIGDHYSSNPPTMDRKHNTRLSWANMRRRGEESMTVLGATPSPQTSRSNTSTTGTTMGNGTVSGRTTAASGRISTSGVATISGSNNTLNDIISDFNSHEAVGSEFQYTTSAGVSPVKNLSSNGSFNLANGSTVKLLPVPEDEKNQQKAQKLLDRENDVQRFCRKTLDDSEKYQLLVNVWTPNASFVFPAAKIGGKNRKFQLSWLQEYIWLSYSAVEDAAYCKICMSFAKEQVGKGNHENSNTLIKNGLKNWKKALDKFKDLVLKRYHTDASTDAHNFMLIYENKKNDVISDIDISRKKSQIENRQKLISIIRAVLFCCRQGIALRGHRDDGPVSMEMPEENDGNFRALLRYAVESGDIFLRSHLMTAGANATYLSYRTQNEIIEARREIVTSEIVNRVNETRCFTVMADETTDISGIEQFSIGARYVQKLEGKHVIREDFMYFVPVEDVTGAGLANTLLTTLKKLGVEIQFMKGQGYDGARAMSGEFKGCAAIVKNSGLDAPYLHCANHNLNLAICHACEIAPIRNCLGTVKKVVHFFRNSNKAGNILKKYIFDSKADAKQTRLLKFCETRWVEHLASLSLFYDSIEFINSALEEMDELKLKADGVQPNELLASIRTPQFIISLAVIKKVFELTKSLSLNLQKEDCDLSQCVEYANDVRAEIKDMRTIADQTFGEIFKSATHIAESIDTAITVPRRAGHQKNRDNFPGNAEEYYRRSIYIPFLDKYSEELESRFLEQRDLLSKIQNLIPSKCAEINEVELDRTISVFKEVWPNEFTETTDQLKTDFKMWRRFCLKIHLKDRPNTFLEALDLCDVQFYKHIYRLLQISATLPVTVASSERSFSTLRRLKTYLRNKTGEERLNGLALLNIHRDIEVTSDLILNILAKKKRRLDITL